MKLQCLVCGCVFEQTEKIVEQAKTNSHLNFFIKYCKNCRRIKTEESLKNIPKILNILSESKNEENNEQ